MVRQYLDNISVLVYTIIRTIIRTGNTCKRIPCYMHDSACRWLIAKKSENVLKLC